MKPRTDTLSERVMAFLAEHRMSKTMLGQKAAGNPHLIFDLFDGKRLMRPDTRDNLEQFMASYRREAA